MTTSIDAMCSILLVSMVLSGTANADATVTGAGFRLDEGVPSSSSNSNPLRWASSWGKAFERSSFHKSKPNEVGLILRERTAAEVRRSKACSDNMPQ